MRRTKMISVFGKLSTPWLLALGLLALVCATADASSPATLEYSWLTVDRISGSQTVSRDADGLTTVRFEYADRGRGPSFVSTFRLDTQGIPRGN